MAHEALKQQVLAANLALVEAGLVVLTWGNASGADRAAGVMAIKPSGIPYAQLTAADIVVLSLETGKVIEAHHRRSSSDTPTHLYLYQQFAHINGIVHTHSTCATTFAQAGRDIPCLGTTHADHFYGPIPCTRPMRDAEIATDYEHNTGRVIVECFHERQLDPLQMPGIVLAGHAPFAWGATPAKAVENAIVLEFSARMALDTLALNPSAAPISRALIDKHFLRKHGPDAYYGQPDK